MTTEPTPTTPAPAAEKKVNRRREPEARAAATVDRLPPYSIEAEQGVLGCIFLAAHECLDLCIEKFKAGPVVFFDLRHQTIYELLVEMHARKEAIDTITVQQRLKDRQQLESIGGIAYLSTLPDLVPSAANVEYYINIVREKYILRQIVTTCTRIESRVYTHEGELDELLDDCERDLMKINAERIESGVLSMAELVHHSLEEMDEKVKNPGQLPGIPTGFETFDKYTLGLTKGNVIVIAARPSVGKTALAVNIGDNIADGGDPVGVISLEMMNRALVNRILSARARVDSKRIRSGELSEDEIRRIAEAGMKVKKLPLYIDDERGINILQLRSKLRRMVQRFGIKVAIIDYLQLLTSQSRRAENRAQVVAEISGAIKNIAGELDIPIIVLSQLNRELDKFGSKGGKPRAPNLADLRESGAIEQDADEVGLLWRPDSREPETNSDEDDVIDVEMLLAKQRNGNTGIIALRLHRRFTLFSEPPKIVEQGGWYGTNT